MKKKSVQSENPCQSVIQTNYDIMKAHGGELKVVSLKVESGDLKGLLANNAGTIFLITLPIT